MVAELLTKTYFYNELDSSAKRKALQEFQSNMDKYFPEGIVDWEIVSESISEDIVELTKSEYEFFFKKTGERDKEEIYWDSRYGVDVNFTNVDLAEDDALQIIIKEYEKKKESGEIDEEKYNIIVKKINLIENINYPGMDILEEAMNDVLDFEPDVYAISEYGPIDLLNLLETFNPEKYKDYRVVHSLMTTENEEEYIEEEEIDDIIEDLSEKIIEFTEEIEEPLYDYIKEYKERIEKTIETSIDYYEGEAYTLEELKDEHGIIYDKIKFDTKGNIVEV